MSDPLTNYLKDRYYNKHPVYRPPVETVVQPETKLTGVQHKKYIKKYREPSEECDECDEVVERIISNKPSVKKVRKLIQQYIDIKEEEEDY